MAATAIKKFANTSALKIIKVANGSDCYYKQEMTATEHDDAYNEITAFINHEVNDNKALILDHSWKQSFAIDIKTNSERKTGPHLRTDFSVCIDTLKDNDIITEAVANEI